MRIFLLFACFLLSLAVSSQTADDYLSKAITKLNEGNCESAQKFYNVYRRLSGKTSPAVEVAITDCEKNIYKQQKPIAYLAYTKDGKTEKYFGTGSIDKASLLNVSGIQIESPDVGTKSDYKILGFWIGSVDAMGKWVYELSGSESFTERQKNLIRKMSSGKIFLISHIKVKNSDGEIFELPTMAVDVY